MHRKPALKAFTGALARQGFVLASLLPFCTSSAHALEFSLADGDVAGRFDNNFSYGIGVRTQGADLDRAAIPLVDGPQGYYADLATRNIKTAANKNDGNLNFPDPGDIVSNNVKWNGFLEITRGDFGAQVSGFAFHDFALADIEDSIGTPEQFGNHVDAGDVYDGRRLSQDAADYAVSDARLSTAYVWGDFQLGSRTLNARLGEQVLSWGEALFLQDGINQVNPADLSALRLPGAEIKDALLPLPMLVLSSGITDALSAEAFYQFGWDRSEADPVGTFYSTTDAFFGYGTKSVIIDMEGSSAQLLAEIYNLYHRGTTPGTALATRVSNNKLPDVKPKDDGQYGINFRYMAEALNNTELGVYFVNVHARKPTAGIVLGEAFGSATDLDTCSAAYQALAGIGVTPASCADNLNILGGSQGASAAQVVGGINAVHYLDSSEYFLQYAEDQQIFGLTFSANVGETSLSGEIAYRPDAEFLPEVGDNLIAYNALNASSLGNGGTTTNLGYHLGNGAALSAGQTVDLTADADMVNVSLLAIHNFGPVSVADALTGVLELGGAWVRGLDSAKLYAAEGALGYALTDTNSDLVPDTPILTEGNPSQYLDDFSWGYRVVLAADFNNIAGGVKMRPQLRFAHDVSGNGIVGGNFMEDRMSATLQFDFEYGENWGFGVGSNSFWGRDGKNEGNQLADRDNLFASVKYSF